MRHKAVKLTKGEYEFLKWYGEAWGCGDGNSDTLAQSGLRTLIEEHIQRDKPNDKITRDMLLSELNH